MFSTKYQLMRVNAIGKEFAITSATGIPLELFDKKKEAIAYANAHPKLFPEGRFLAKAIELTTVKEPAATTSE